MRDGHSKSWLAILMAGFVATFFACGGLLIHLFPRAHPASVRSEAFASLSPATRVLVLGTSHVAFGVDASRFERPAAALAAGALNYELMELILDRALSRAPNVEQVVIEVDIIPLRADSMEKFNGDFSQIYSLGLRWTDLPRSWSWKLRQALRESKPLFPFFFAKRLVPRTFVWDGAGSKSLERTVDLVRGFVASTEVIAPWRDGAVVVGFHKEDLKPNRWRENTAALMRMLDRLHQERRAVYLVRLPHHFTYVEAEPGEWEDQVSALVQTIKTQYPELPYFDWMVIPDYDNKDFADGHHLNVQGARRLTDRLVQALRRPEPEMEH